MNITMMEIMNRILVLTSAVFHHQFFRQFGKPSGIFKRFNAINFYIFPFLARFCSGLFVKTENLESTAGTEEDSAEHQGMHKLKGKKHRKDPEVTCYLFQ